MTDVDDVVRGLKCCRDWESLRGILPECADCPFSDESEGTCEDMKKQINAAIDLIEARKWISVKDRLPEEEFECLVVCGDKWVEIGYYHEGGQKWAIDGAFCADGYVTHWMPLPTPPEVNRNDD